MEEELQSIWLQYDLDCIDFQRDSNSSCGLKNWWNQSRNRSKHLVGYRDDLTSKACVQSAYWAILPRHTTP
jgi:hypothetical protein